MDIVTNIGNHYDPSNATFTCPTKGMYMFSVSLLGNYYDYDSLVAIMRDGNVLIDVFLDGNSSSYVVSSASAVIVAECDIGQQIYVEATGNAYIDGNRMSSHFSGALIQRV